MTVPEWWPANAPDRYVDDDGVAHDWDEFVPDEDGGYDDEYTYRDMVVDRAESRGMTVEEYFGSLSFLMGQQQSLEDDEDDYYGDEEYD